MTTLGESGATYRAALERLSAARGVLTAYTDAFGERRVATDEALARVLAALGSPAGSEAEALRSLRRLDDERRRRWIEPVIVSWIGRRSSAAISPPEKTGGRIEWSIRLEAGGEVGGIASLARLTRQGRPVLPLPASLPPGYHALRLRVGRERIKTTIIRAPPRAYAPERAGSEWGLFCPAYALRSERNWGVGDLSDLRALASWGRSLGGRVVATLPMLASHLGHGGSYFDPSPYVPVSRLFWNELFVDATLMPEFERCAEARRLVNSWGFRREAASLRRLELVDYRRAAALKRRVLDCLAETFFAGGGERSPVFTRFMAENPLARDYAAFRAEEEHARTRRYHLYAQYAAWIQLTALGAGLHAAGDRLYLDMPVGVSERGFDVRRFPRVFARGVSAGAPADAMFTSGQDWRFPPMHPEGCREGCHAYFRACLGSHMRHADVLRLDHVMMLHRLFWIPQGMPADEGLYVRYPSEEMYAILCLESHRHRCRLVGENLGTVPPEVNEALRRRRLLGLYVAQCEARAAGRALRPLPRECVASLNTHDLPPIAAFLSGRDIGERARLGVLESRRRRQERAARGRVRKALVAFLRAKRLLPRGRDDAGAVRDALHEWLGRSESRLMLVNIEDLWLETRCQNVPGTIDEHPNWRRKLRKTLEEIVGNRRVERLLKRIDGARRGR